MYGSRLIGKRFPIVQVTIGSDQLEVSSFATGMQLSDLPFDAAALLGNKVSGRQCAQDVQEPWSSWEGCGTARFLIPGAESE